MKVLLFLLIVSCSTPQYTLKQNELLPYKESSQVTKVKKANKALNFVGVFDRRDRQHIGKAYTGVQYQETPINLDKSLKPFLKSYLTDAFEMRNIRFNAASDLELKVEVEKFWVEEVIEKFQPEKAKCIVQMNFHINGKKQKWSGQFWTEFTSAGDLRDGTERLPPTLASCMNDIVEKVVNDKKFLKNLK